MKQELLLEQRLLLTPQLLLNLKLLTLPTIELQNLIQKELETNPALQTTEEEPEDVPIPPERYISQARTTPSEPEDSSAPNTEDWTIADFIQDDGVHIPTESEAMEFDPLETYATAPVSLAEVILPKLRSLLTDTELPVAEYIIENLDEDGFLQVEKEEIMNTFKISSAKLNRILQTLQYIELGGLATKNTQEALLVQLELLGYDRNSLEYRIVEKYYKPMCKKQYTLIARSCNVSEKNVRDAILNIAQLEPKPARRFTQSNPVYVAPDFKVEWQEDKLVAVMIDDILPQLRLARRYREIILNPKSFPKEEVSFARAKLKSALMLIKGIESRKRTLKRVMDYILKEQQDFFQRGQEFLKPISIQNTGKALGIHPSTISRAIQGKYVETPFGIFPMRFFFVSGTGDVARHSLKDKIRQIIENEDKETPYSDDEIAMLLNKQGIKISRRTVAKYRDELKIPGCSERRRI